MRQQGFCNKQIKMKGFSQKKTRLKLLSQLAESIGTQIRKQIIASRRPSPEKQFSIRKINKVKTQPFNPQQQDKQFWTNPYKTKQKQWNCLTPSKSFFGQKEDIDQYKKYELQKFKQKLKTSLQDINSSKQLRMETNQSRIKSFRQNLTQARKQKIESVLYHKQLQAEQVRRILYRKKAQAKIQKRKVQLDIQFNKWRRQQQKLLKHHNLLQQNSQININN